MYNLQNLFPHSVGCPFTLLVVFLEAQKMCYFDDVTGACLPPGSH